MLLSAFLGAHVGQTYGHIIRESFLSGQNSVFIGYSPQHKGVKCLDVSTGRVYISRDVVFDETVFPFRDLHPNAGALLQKEILLLPAHLSGLDQGGNNTTDHMNNSHATNPIDGAEST